MRRSKMLSYTKLKNIHIKIESPIPFARSFAEMDISIAKAVKMTDRKQPEIMSEKPVSNDE